MSSRFNCACNALQSKMNNSEPQSAKLHKHECRMLSEEQQRCSCYDEAN